MVRAKNGQFEIAELKSEVSESTRTGNLFLESWSNRERGEVGWLHKSVASVLFYHFLGDDHLFILRMKALKEWALRDKVIDRFKERMQSKHVQANDTYGWCVPISVLKNEMPRGTLKIHRPKSELDSYARSKNVTENEESFISTLF